MSRRSRRCFGSEGRDAPQPHRSRDALEHIPGRDYTLARLDRAGELSANKAMIEAGFRKQPTSFEQIVKPIVKHRAVLTAAEKRKLKEMLA